MKTKPNNQQLRATYFIDHAIGGIDSPGPASGIFMTETLGLANAMLRINSGGRNQVADFRRNPRLVLSKVLEFKSGDFRKPDTNYSMRSTHFFPERVLTDFLRGFADIFLGKGVSVLKMSINSSSR